MDGRKVIYKGGSFDITLREAMFSIVIVLLMLTAGFFISENIASRNDEAYQEYYEAIKIDEDSELFRYGMRTDVGKAFVFGTLAAVDVVTDPAIEGEYAYIEVVEEHKVKHTRTRTVDGTNMTDGKGIVMRYRFLVLNFHMARFRFQLRMRKMSRVAAIISDMFTTLWVQFMRGRFIQN